MTENGTILLTGATGYVGGRLCPLLVAEGWRVRCMARRPEDLTERVPNDVHVVRGDVFEPESLRAALNGVQVAFYLVHSMGASGDFVERDYRAAKNFCAAAKAAGVERIIYLGGLGENAEDLSAHLKSRQEVGDTLRASGVPIIEFRASIIIGSGSFSFEMIRALVERLPVMITPRWVRVQAQPIAVDDVLAYLRAGVSLKTSGNLVFEIGGPDRVSYRDIMREYARKRGLKRLMISVPFLSPRLSSLWLGLVTPLHTRVGRKLIDSIRHSTVVRNDAAQRTFSVQPIGVSEAILQALRREDLEYENIRWSNAPSAKAESSQEWGGKRLGNRLVDSRSARIEAVPERVFPVVERIGGDAGWYYANWLWKLRGVIDLLVGGVGLSPGRRDPARLEMGDPLDCWRVESLDRGRRLRLVAEMKLPGRAWLDFEVRPDGGGTRICQTAIFDPVGLCGLAYWYAVWPLHQLVFAGMLRGIAKAAVTSVKTRQIADNSEIIH